jgi:DNA-binding MarR family transcriptional regulator
MNVRASDARPRTGRETPVDYAALASFRYEIRQFLRLSEEAARAAGLEPRQHQLLLAIRGASGGTSPTIAYLAERLQLRHHSVVGLVDRLQRHALVRRRRDPADHRRVIVTLTRTGANLLRRLSIVHQNEIRSLAASLVASLTAIVRATRPAAST